MSYVKIQLREKKLKIFKELKKRTEIYRPLVHQIATEDTLLSKDLVVNVNDTGSGKTNAVLRYLDHLPSMIEKRKIMYQVRYLEQKIALYITPTNALVSQTTEDILNYVRQHKLDWNIFPINAYTLKHLRKYYEIRGNEGNGRLLSILFNNPTSIVSKLKNVMVKDLQYLLSEIKDDGRPFLYIINPDILYYALFDVYYRFRQANIVKGLLDKLKYVIFDEFHFYEPIQLVALYFLLAIWKVMGRFNNKEESTKIALLSATPNEELYQLCEKNGISVGVISENSKDYDPELMEYKIFLTALNLTIHKSYGTDSFYTNIMKNKDTIQSYLEEGKFGVVICNFKHHADSLTEYFKGKFPEQVGKITGGENLDDRREAVQKPLLIVTSTVDLGFNFEREEQTDRQNIDYVFTDFETLDQLQQRLGRGGRVLKKKITDQITEGHIFLQRGLFDQITDLVNNTEYERDTFFEMFEQIITSRKYQKNFFKKYGGFVTLAGLNILRKNANALYNNEFNQPWVEKFDEIQEIMMALMDMDENDIKRSFSLFKSYQKYKSENDCAISFGKLTPKNKKYLLSYFFGDSSYFDYSEHRAKTGWECFETVYNCSVAKTELYEYIKEIKKADPKQLWEMLDQHPLSNMIKSMLSNYWKYFQKKLRVIKQSFRSSNNFDITLNDPKGLVGSTGNTYNFWYIYHYYDYDLISNTEKYTELEILKSRPYRENVLTIPMPNITKEEFENSEGKRYGLYKFMVIENGELSNTSYPQKIQEELAREHIVYFVPNSYGMLRMYTLYWFGPFKVNLNFTYDRGEYYMFLDKDAFVVDSILRERNNTEEVVHARD